MIEFNVKIRMVHTSRGSLSFFTFKLRRRFSLTLANLIINTDLHWFMTVKVIDKLKNVESGVCE